MKRVKRTGGRRATTAEPARAAPAKRSVGFGRKAGEYDWTLGETLWNQGVAGREIAKRLGCSDPTVYAYAAKHWRKRERVRKATTKGDSEWME